MIELVLFVGQAMGVAAGLAALRAGSLRAAIGWAAVYGAFGWIYAMAAAAWIGLPPDPWGALALGLAVGMPIYAATLGLGHLGRWSARRRIAWMERRRAG